MFEYLVELITTVFKPIITQYDKTSILILLMLTTKHGTILGFNENISYTSSPRWSVFKTVENQIDITLNYSGPVSTLSHVQPYERKSF